MEPRGDLDSSRDPMDQRRRAVRHFFRCFLEGLANEQTARYTPAALKHRHRARLQSPFIGTGLTPHTTIDRLVGLCQAFVLVNYDLSNDNELARSVHY